MLRVCLLADACSDGSCGWGLTPDQASGHGQAAEHVHNVITASHTCFIRVACVCLLADACSDGSCGWGLTPDQASGHGQAADHARWLAAIPQGTDTGGLCARLSLCIAKPMLQMACSCPSRNRYRWVVCTFIRL